MPRRHGVRAHQVLDSMAWRTADCQAMSALVSQGVLGMRVRALRTAAAGLLGLSLLLAGCTSTAKASTSSKTILNVATTAAITTWDPVKSFSTEVFYLANIYEPLDWVSSQGTTQKFTPGLATS